jgi:uncharacterized protein YndB with AHSA1/START domain
VSETVVTRTVDIDAPAPTVWQTLTERMPAWLTEHPVRIDTDWRVGGPIVFAITEHGATRTDKGVVLAFEEDKVLRYSHWSPVSEVPDLPEAYTIIELRLETDGARTRLTVTHANLATWVMLKHCAFYWTVALNVIKKLAEGKPIRTGLEA